MQGQLVARLGAEDSCVYRLVPTMTIGRAEDNSIVLASPHVSHHHAELRWDGEHYVLYDLGSRNGTYLNNQRLATPQRLEHGDHVQIGGIELAFQTTIPLDETLPWQPRLARTGEANPGEEQPGREPQHPDIRIDEMRRSREVAEMTENEYFQKLQQFALERHGHRDPSQ